MSDLGAHDNAADHAEILLIGAAVLIAQSNPILFIGHIEIIILIYRYRYPHLSLSRTAVTAARPLGTAFACA